MKRIPRILKVMSRPRRLVVLLLLATGGISGLHAQYEVKSGAYNRLSQRVPQNNTTRIAPVGPSVTPSGDPTITPQYSNVVETSASAGPVSTAVGYPSSIVSGAG